MPLVFTPDGGAAGLADLGGVALELAEDGEEAEALPDFPDLPALPDPHDRAEPGPEPEPEPGEEGEEGEEEEEEEGEREHQQLLEGGAVPGRGRQASILTTLRTSVKVILCAQRRAADAAAAHRSAHPLTPPQCLSRQAVHR
jgi:hypothetical protein